MPYSCTCGHTFPRPAWHIAQEPQASSGSTATRSPVATRVTPSPTTSTSPKISWPGTWPSGQSPAWRKWRSVPQMPQASMRTRAKPGSGSGSGTCCSWSLPGPPTTAARIVIVPSSP